VSKTLKLSTTEPREIALVSQARVALAEARSIDEVKDIRDKAEAMRLYLKQRDESLEAQNTAAEIKLWAERRAGEMLAHMKKSGERDQGSGGDRKSQSHDVTVIPSKLSDLGVDKMESSRWQTIASMPEKEFEQHIEKAKSAGEGLTTNSVLRKAKEKKRETTKEEKRTELKAKAKAAPKSDDWQVIDGACGDTLKTLTLRSARLIFADPPYNIGWDYGEDGHDDAMPSAAYLSLCKGFINASVPILTDDGSLWVLINHEWAARIELMIVEAGLVVRDWITWYESFGVNCTNKFNRTSRRLFHAVKDPNRFVFNADAVNRPSDRQARYNDKRADPGGKVWDDVWGVNPSIPRLNGTFKERIPDASNQLPLALLNPIVGCASDPGDLVVDPFCGSGTTGEAALRLGRRFLGIEKDARFAELSRTRLAAVKGECSGTKE
jgi:DNA modification methylase